MNFPTLLRQQIHDELGPSSQVSQEIRPVLLARFERDMESEACALLLTEKEKEEIQALLHSLSQF